MHFFVIIIIAKGLIIYNPAILHCLFRLVTGHNLYYLKASLMFVCGRLCLPSDEMFKWTRISGKTLIFTQYLVTADDFLYFSLEIACSDVFFTYELFYNSADYYISFLIAYLCIVYLSIYWYVEEMGKIHRKRERDNFRKFSEHFFLLLKICTTEEKVFKCFTVIRNRK